MTCFILHAKKVVHCTSTPPFFAVIQYSAFLNTCCVCNVNMYYVNSIFVVAILYVNNIFVVIILYMLLNFIPSGLGF